MSIQSQSQNLKTCNSCKRNLHLSYFGFSRKNLDGYCPTCKECRNYRRRIAYNNTFSNELFVMPLNENNKYILNDVFKVQNDRDIQALQLSSNTAIVVKVKNDPTGVIIFEILDPQTKNKDTYMINSSEKRVIELFSVILNLKCIRLFPVEQPIAIYEWLCNHP